MGKSIIIYKVREMRQKRGWSLRKLSSLAGMSASHLSDVENNMAHLTIPGIWDLADALECFPSDLYERK